MPSAPKPAGLVSGEDDEDDGDSSDSGSISSASSHTSSNGSSSGNDGEANNHTSSRSGDEQAADVATAGAEGVATTDQHGHHEGFPQAEAIAGVLTQMVEKPHKHISEKIVEVGELQTSVSEALRELQQQHHRPNSEKVQPASTPVQGMFGRLGSILGRSNTSQQVHADARSAPAATSAAASAAGPLADTGAYSPPPEAEAAAEQPAGQPSETHESDASGVNAALQDTPGAAAAAAAAAAAQVPALLARIQRLQQRRARLVQGAAALEADSQRLARVCDAHIADVKRMAEEEAAADMALQESVVSIT